MIGPLRFLDDESLDERRGIKNARAERRGGGIPPEYDQSVERRFLEEESVQAKAARKRVDPAQEEEEISREDERKTAESLRRKLARKVKLKSDTVGRSMLKRRGMSGFARWGGIGIALKAYVWQAIFGILSLMAFIAQSQVVAFKEETFFGKLLGFFVSFDKFFPGEAIGFIFYGLATIIAVSTILLFQAWYTIAGHSSFKTLFSTIATFLLWALSVLPVGNIFPTLLIWIVWRNLSSLSRKR